LYDSRLVDIFTGVAYCSGHLIADRLVLTAAHVLGIEVNVEPRVRRLVDTGEGHTCRVAWQNPNLNVDLALLEITDPHWMIPDDLWPLRWGRFPNARYGRDMAYKVAARGFPIAQARSGGGRDTEELAGLVRLGTGMLSSTFQIQVISGDLGKVGTRSGWHGMSGAAVLCDDLIVGVLVEDTPLVPSRLTATPTTALVSDPTAAVILAAHNVPTTLTAIHPARPGAPQIRAQVGAIPQRAIHYQQRAEGDALHIPTADVHSEFHTYVISGMGGIGKTQVAAEYARRLWDSQAIEWLVWISATSREAIVAAYADAAIQLGIVQSHDREPAEARLLRSLAETRSRWLVVLDDLQSAGDVRGLWPPNSPHGQTVVTTRRREAALTHVGRSVEINLFSPDQAHAYLHRWLGSRPSALAEVDELAADLGYLPLALAQAAAYVVDQSLTCAMYRVAISDRRRPLDQLVPEIESLPDEHGRTIGASLTLSVPAADKLRPIGTASKMLQLCAVLDSNGIPLDVLLTRAAHSYLLDTASADSRQGSNLSSDPGEAHDAVMNLHRFHLIDVVEKMVRVHALVQRAVSETMHESGHIGAVVRTAAEALLQTWPSVDGDPEHARALQRNAAALRTANPEALWSHGAHPVLFAEASSLAATGLLTTAIEHYAYLRAEAERRLGHEHVHTLNILSHLVRFRGIAGDWTGASEASEQLVARYQEALGTDHPQTLLAEANLAYSRGANGDAAGAAALFAQVVNDHLLALGADHPDTLNAQNSLGHWLGEAGRPAEAVEVFEQLVTDYERLHGPDHLETLTSRSNVASWCSAAGDRWRAVALFQLLLRDCQRVLGIASPLTLDTRRQLGRLRGELGDPAGAAAVLEDVLTDCLRRLGPGHPETLATRDALAYWREHAGDLVGAAVIYEHLLNEQLSVLGPDHPNVVTTRNCIARLHREINEQGDELDRRA
jgi:tetratricopeptide (TPR) repeat protein